MAAEPARGKCPVVRWRDVGHEGVMAFMAPLLAENRPFLMSGYWTHQVLCKDAAQRWRTFAGIKSVLSSHGLDQLRVDVSCTKKGHSFRGDQANRQHVSLRLMDMVELAEANEAGQPHWAAAEEVGLDYYLCQCPVVSREVGKPEVLSAVAGEFRTPSCVLEEDLLQINLWLGAMETTTNMHYDANHNLLFVLKGSKRVALLPPDMTGGVHAMPVFSESSNHCGLRHEDAAGVAGSAEGMRKGAVYADVAEGEALFIPEGWWHQITSSRGTVAANVWFKGVRPALCEGPSRHMREYYLRCLVGSLLADRLREAVTDDERGFDTDGRVAGNKRPRPPPAVEMSPLSAPASTTEERNAYLRTIGTDRMKDELPRIALERPPDWARLVTGLDPFTAHVVTTKWEAAGGAAKMPEFYEAIFGRVEERAGAGNVDSGAGGAIAVGSEEVRIGGGVSSDVGGGVEGAAADAAMNAAFGDSSIEDAAQLQQPHQLAQHVVGADAGAAAAAAAAASAAVASAAPAVTATGQDFRRNEAFSGIALQEKLVRLREMFAQEQCGKILSGAVGW